MKLNILKQYGAFISGIILLCAFMVGMANATTYTTAWAIKGDYTDQYIGLLESTNTGALNGEVIKGSCDWAVSGTYTSGTAPTWAISLTSGGSGCNNRSLNLTGQPATTANVEDLGGVEVPVIETNSGHQSSGYLYPMSIYAAQNQNAWTWGYGSVTIVFSVQESSTRFANIGSITVSNGDVNPIGSLNGSTYTRDNNCTFTDSNNTYSTTAGSHGFIYGGAMSMNNTFGSGCASSITEDFWWVFSDTNNGGADQPGRLFIINTTSGNFKPGDGVTSYFTP